MQRAAEAYMATRPARIVVNGGCGTARGYKALLDGTTDIAMASGSAPDDLRAAAARNRPLRATVVSRDAILALVHASIPLATLRLSAARADDAAAGRGMGLRLVIRRAAMPHAGSGEANKSMRGPYLGGIY
jgi:ABC-type phosphate transport system substrate-binding protein